jgi:ubiquinone/menaquinone biosynthesis C-methylase UbiE
MLRVWFSGLKLVTYLVEYHLLRVLASVLRLPLDPRPKRTAAQKQFVQDGASAIWREYRTLLRSRPGASRRPRIGLHLRRLASVAGDLPSYLRRKRAGDATDLDHVAIADDIPAYYRLNFHYQTDGYFSERSALRYDHQIELLFVGMAHMVRKVAYSLLDPYLEPAADVLEFGAGTGTSGDQFKMIYPGVALSLLDPSEPYLSYAEKTYPRRFAALHGQPIETLERVEAYDAIFSCFTMHEIPTQYWTEVFERVQRALRPGGALLLVDAMQESDGEPEQLGLDHLERQFFEPHFAGFRVTPLEHALVEAGLELVCSRQVMVSKAVLARKSPAAAGAVQS